MWRPAGLRWCALHWDLRTRVGERRSGNGPCSATLGERVSFCAPLRAVAGLLRSADKSTKPQRTPWGSWTQPTTPPPLRLAGGQPNASPRNWRRTSQLRTPCAVARMVSDPTAVGLPDHPSPIHVALLLPVAPPLSGRADVRVEQAVQAASTAQQGICFDSQRRLIPSDRASTPLTPCYRCAANQGSCRLRAPRSLLCLRDRAARSTLELQAPAQVLGAAAPLAAAPPAACARRLAPQHLQAGSGGS